MAKVRQGGGFSEGLVRTIPLSVVGGTQHSSTKCYAEKRLFKSAGQINRNGWRVASPAQKQPAERRLPSSPTVPVVIRAVSALCYESS